MMQLITEGIWTVPAPLTFSGLKLNTRMTVCRLSDGGLALISLVPHTEDLQAAIDALGPVRSVIAPNLLHHLYLGEWIAAYPDAVSYGPPGLTHKRSDLTLSHELGDDFTGEVDVDLRWLPIAGMPKLNESMFFHVPSRTLVVTDLCFYMPDATGLTGLFASLMGITKRARCEPLFKVLIKDKRAFKASLEPLRSLDIDHLSMCHHSVMSDGAAQALQQVLDQLKVPRPSDPDR